MFNFTKGGVQDGTIQPSAPQAAAQPPRPPGIPEHYVFDNEVELWMPPSAISKAAAVAPVGGGPGGDITVIKSSAATPSPYAANSNDPICFEYTNTGVCGRLARGEICRYRHLPPNHPEVIADKIKQGKAPGAMPTPPMGNFVENLARLGSQMHGAQSQQVARPAHGLAMPPVPSFRLPRRAAGLPCGAFRILSLPRVWAVAG